MKKLFFLLTFIINCLGCYAQNFEWARMISSVYSEVGYSIVNDDFGNVYTTGKFSGTCDFDPGLGVFNLTSGGGDNIFISKLSASGVFVWAKSFVSTGGAVGNCIKIDRSGNVYTTGFFGNTVDFDPGPNVFNLSSSNGLSDIFLSKLDADGNFIWAKNIGGSSNYDIGYYMENPVILTT